MIANVFVSQVSTTLGGGGNVSFCSQASDPQGTHGICQVLPRLEIPRCQMEVLHFSDLEIEYNNRNANDSLHALIHLKRYAFSTYLRKTLKNIRNILLNISSLNTPFACHFHFQVVHQCV